jgi:hypothetical protein
MSVTRRSSVSHTSLSARACAHVGNASLLRINHRARSTPRCSPRNRLREGPSLSSRRHPKSTAVQSIPTEQCIPYRTVRSQVISTGGAQAAGITAADILIESARTTSAAPEQGRYNEALWTHNATTPTEGLTGGATSIPDSWVQRCTYGYILLTDIIVDVGRQPACYAVRSVPSNKVTGDARGAGGPVLAGNVR